MLLNKIRAVFFLISIFVFTLSAFGQEVQSMTVTLTNDSDGADEYLQSTVSKSSISLSSDNTDTLSFTNLGAATNSEFEEIIKGIKYRNSSLNPTEGNRTITFVINDGVNNSEIATSYVDVKRVVNEVSTIEDIHSSFTADNFSSQSFASIVIVSNATVGTLYLDLNGNGIFDSGEEVNTTNNTTITIDQINNSQLKFKPEKDQFQEGYSSFGYKIVDTNGAISDPLPLTINVSANQEDNIVSLIISLTNDSDGADEYLQSTVSKSSIALSGDNKDILSFTNLGAATNSEFEEIIKGIKYINSSLNPTEGNRTITFVINDGVSNSGIATSYVDVKNVNDAPTVTGTVVTNASEDSRYSYTLVGNDVDGDDLNWGVKSGVDLPDWLKLKNSKPNQLLTVLDTGLNQPYRVAVNSIGEVYIADTQNSAIKKIALDGTVSTVLDSGLVEPSGIEFDSNGVLYISDRGNNTIQKIALDGAVSTVLDSGLNGPTDIAIDSSGVVYIADTGNNAIKKVTLDGTVSTVLDSGLYVPTSIAIDDNKVIYIADTGNHAIKKLEINGTLVIVNNVSVNSYGLSLDSSGVLYFTDFISHTIKKLETDGTLSTVVDSGLISPFGIDIDVDDNIYVTNVGDNTIKKLTSNSRLVGTPTNADVGVHDINLILSDGNGEEVEHNFQITVNNVNDAPTNISFASSASVNQSASANAPVSALTSTDVDSTNFSYSLVSTTARGNGTCSSSASNSLFTISTTTLKAINPATLSAGIHNVCIQTNDGDLTYKKSLSITVVDDVKPTITISSNKDALKNGETATITFTLSETSVNFISSDVSVGGGSISVLTGSGAIYTTTFTPSDKSTTAATINVAADKFTDSAGNNNTVATQKSISIDTVVPTVTITSNKDALKANETATITFTLSESSSNFAFEDIVVSGGTLSSLSGMGSSYTATFTPTVKSTTGTINVAVDKFTDSAGNNNSAATQKSISIDTVVPTVTITSDKTSLINKETATITFALSEYSEDFALEDIRVVGGKLSDLAPIRSIKRIVAPTYNYQATLTVDDTTTTNVTIDVNASTFTDAASNDNSAAMQKVIPIAPSVITYTPALDATDAAIDSKLILEFSEEVIKGKGNILVKKLSDNSIVETIDVTSDAVSIVNTPIVSAEPKILLRIPAPVTPNKSTVSITRSVNFDLNEAYYVTMDTTVFKDINENNYRGIADNTIWKFTSVDNAAPIITNNTSNASASITVAENETSVVDIDATDVNTEQTLTYSISGTDASSFNIDASSGVITFKIVADYETKKLYSITTTVKDNGGGLLSDSQDLTINISDVNEAPTSSNVSFTINEDKSKTFASTDFNFADVDSANSLQALVITSLPVKGNLILDGSAVVLTNGFKVITLPNIAKLVYTPAANENGTAYTTFKFRVDDGNSTNSTSVDYTTTINVTAVDDAPVITTTLLNVIQDEDGKGLVIDLNTTDVDTNTTTFTPSYKVTTSNDGLVTAYVKDGKLIVNPKEHANGEVTITVTSTVNGVSSTKTFTYTLTAVNDAPTISDISDISLEQSSSVINKVVTFDIWDDQEVVSLSATSSNVSMLSNANIEVEKLSNSEARLSYTLDANITGTTIISVLAKDAEDLEYTESFTIDIKASNDALCVGNMKSALVFNTIKGNNEYQDSITDPLVLDTTIPSVCDATISWSSSATTVIDNDGIVTQGDSNQTIILKADINKGQFNDSVEFILTVPSDSLSDEEIIKMLSFNRIKEDNPNKFNITSKLNLIDSILGETISWSSSDENVISPYSGFVTRYSEDKEITLTATIGTETKVFILTVLKEETSDEDKVTNDLLLLNYQSILGDNKSKDDVIYDLDKPLPTTGANGSTITWSSSNSDVITSDGNVFRDANGNKYVTLTATVTKGSSSTTKDFTFEVLQNEIETSTTSFVKTVDTPDGIKVETTQDGEPKETELSFSEEILKIVEQVISQDSIKSVVEFVDKILDIYLNTDGTSQSTLQLEDVESSTLKNETNDSSTSVDDNGNVESTNTTFNGSVVLKLNSDGTVEHRVVNTTENKTTTASSKIPGSSVTASENGDLETKSEVKQGGYIYKAVVITNSEGQSKTKFVKVNLQTGDEEEIENTLATDSQSFVEGNTVEISQETDGSIIITITTTVDQNMQF